MVGVGTSNFILYGSIRLVGAAYNANLQVYLEGDFLLRHFAVESSVVMHRRYRCRRQGPISTR